MWPWDPEQPQQSGAEIDLSSDRNIELSYHITSLLCLQSFSGANDM